MNDPRSSSSLFLVAVLAGCSAASAEPGHGGGAASAARRFTEELDGFGTSGGFEPAPFVDDEALDFEPAPAPEPTPVPEVDRPDPAPAQREPIGYRIARQGLTVHTAPDPRSAERARIPMFDTFAVLAHVAGPDCAAPGWAEVGDDAYVCLEQTRKTGKRRPRAVPRMRGYDGLTPHYYAKVRKGESPRRWRSLADFTAGRPAVDVLEPQHDYAFTTRRRVRGEIVLVDDRHRVVREAEVHLMRPSRFAGHDLKKDPVPSGRRLAWVVKWPEGEACTEPSGDAPLAASLGYHDELLVDPEPVEAGGARWYKLEHGGWVSADHLSLWEAPAELPPGVGDDEVWVDVDLARQTLGVMQGSEPVFATLISSGFKGPTPRGLFRIHHKLTVGGMSSSPGDEEYYNVEEVPFVQYFVGSYALHGAFWHNRFGHPTSHGCVNLSPVDARTVYLLTSPAPHGGWAETWESPGHPGTTVRIHRGDEVVADRRDEVEPKMPV